MTEADLHELILIHAEQIDAAFEFWLTISFGVLVAIHIAGQTIIMRLKILLCSLYVAASSVSILLSVGDLVEVLELMKQLDTEQASKPLNIAAVLIRMILYLLGTAVISIAVFRYQNWIGKKPPNKA